MTIKPYKIWTLLKLKIKNENQKIVCVHYVKGRFSLKKLKSLNYSYRTDHFAQCFEDVK